MDKVKDIALIRMIKRGVSIENISNYLNISVKDINEFKKIIDVVNDLKKDGVSNVEISNTLGLSMDEIKIILDSPCIDNSAKKTQKEDGKVCISNGGKTFGSVYSTKEIQDEIMGYLFSNGTYSSSSSINTNYQNDLSLTKTAKDICTDFGSYVVRSLKKK